MAKNRINSLDSDREDLTLPLYEYQCKKCHSLTERIQKFSDPPLTVCPHCGGELEQLISASAIQFKGSGWYVSDYAKKSRVAVLRRATARCRPRPRKARARLPKTRLSGKDSSNSSKGKSGEGKDKTAGKK